jgi:hypothetical protein
MSGTDGQESETSRDGQGTGVSPYSTGGGGVSFERRVAASYLALLLTGEGAPELGDSRRVVGVAFQQAPQIAVDDLVVLAARTDEEAPTLELAIAVRRAPQIIQSDDDTAALFTQFLGALADGEGEYPQRRVALAVSGPQTHAQQLAELAALASQQRDAADFFDLLRTKQKFRAELVGRLDHVQALVVKALAAQGATDANEEVVLHRTWTLLAHLTVLMPRYEAPDISDWEALRNRLVSVARGNDLVAAGSLRDRFETLAGTFAPSAAAVDRHLLLGQVHALVDSGAVRTARGWQLLGQLQTQALAAAREHAGRLSDGPTLRIDRAGEGAALIEAAAESSATVVHGESGVGKTALVLHSAVAAAANDIDFQVVCINLRHLPETTLELVSALGSQVEEMFRDLSGSRQMLIVDGADAALEGRQDVFAYLVRAAHQTGVAVIAVTATDSRQTIVDVLEKELGVPVRDHRVDGLSDDQLSEVVEAFPGLTRLAANPRSRELLRRLVVVDLLVRSGLTTVPLSDVEAMTEIWSGLVRNRENRDRGLPDAREHALLRIADHELARRNAVDALGELDPEAVAGLRRDGLLRPSTGSAWELVPQFAHDELRRYAVARMLLADGDPVARLQAAEAPRWVLPAARLACQAQLSAPQQQETLTDRFRSVQASFDSLAVTYGARWGDVPGEALLTVADPAPLLKVAWPNFVADDASGLRRLLRLLQQRHHGDNGIVDVVVAEPVIERLLDDVRPWKSEDTARALREWLQALVVQDVEAEHPLRLRLRQLLVDESVAADQRLADHRAAVAAALAARTPEQAEADMKRIARNQLFAEIGYSGRRKRQERPEVPRELTDDTFLELLALLGRDVGEEGEQVLRRVAADAPWDLAPAVEEILTGRALGSYGRGLLATLTEAYYLDEEEDGAGFHEDGIRDHRWRGPVSPLAAWYRGPFMSLFQTDLAAGIRVLNRMLNHAAKARGRILASLGNPWGHAPDESLDVYKLELTLTGSPSTYYGDSQTWYWYRGTGVGPYPCMSALQALERVCDQVLELDVAPDRLVSLLLAECENLAMPGMVVGMLTRHIEKAGALLDPYLADPRIWELEFGKAVAELSGLAANSEGITNADRRTWSLREVATWLVIHADTERTAKLRSIGDQLITSAERLAAHGNADGEPQAEDASGGGGATYVTSVRNWASTLDRDTYSVHEEGGKLYIQSEPPADVRAALEPGTHDLQRGQEAMRLISKYLTEPRAHPEKTTPFSADELVQDLATAKSLRDDPPTFNTTGNWDAPVAVAAAALEAHFLHDVALPFDQLQFAMEIVIAVAEGADPPSEFESTESYFEQGSDRVAARVVPLLLLPQAESLAAENGQPLAPQERILDAAGRLAQAIPLETRLHLARGLDPLWATPCSGDPCHHDLAIAIALDTMRDCVLGEWDSSVQKRRIELVGDPVDDAMRSVDHDAIYVAKLDPAIRALAVAAASSACVSNRAKTIEIAFFDAHRRGLLAHETNYDQRGSHALVVARAMLSLVTSGDPAPLEEHIAAYADSAELLSSFLHAIAAAAEETDSRANAARRCWPQLINQVLEFHTAGRTAFDDRHYGATCLAALMPRPMAEWLYLYREVESVPLKWADVHEWRAEIDAWVPHAAGEPECVDSLIGLLLTSLTPGEQATIGLPWVSSIALADVEASASRSWLLATWLIDIRAAATDTENLVIWQSLVDALVVAGENRLVPYSE